MTNKKFLQNHLGKQVTLKSVCKNGYYEPMGIIVGVDKKSVDIAIGSHIIIKKPKSELVVVESKTVWYKSSKENQIQ